MEFDLELTDEREGEKVDAKKIIRSTEPVR